MSIVLNNQIEASEKSADQLEKQLTRAPERAAVCHDVEALMESVVDIVDDLNHHVDRWQSDIANGQRYEESDANAFFALFSRVEKTAARTSELGRKMESWGFQMAGKGQFLNMWRKLKAIVSVSPNRVAESLAQIRRGETRTLGDFADELSRGIER